MKPGRLVLLVVVFAVPVRGEDLPPLSYDAAKAKKVVEAKLASTMEITWDAYKAVGKRDRKWDRWVELAMKAHAEAMHGPEWDRWLKRAQYIELVATAIEAGCDDPMVRYFNAKMATHTLEDLEKHCEQMHEAVKTLAASKYPILLKIDAWSSDISVWHEKSRLENLSKDEEKTVIESLDEVLKLLAKACGERKAAQRDELIKSCEFVYQNGHKVGQRAKWFERLNADVFAKLEKDDVVANTVTGTFLVDHAWEARGIGVASTVTPAQFQLFSDRLKEAEERLTRAWEQDKECAAAASKMITVCMGREHKRDVMETWFSRAVEADPTYLAAYRAKQNYLYPKWHGSEKETLEFCRQIMKLSEWDAGLPMVALSAYRELAGLQGAPAFFRKRPEIWIELVAILNEMRKRYPKSALGASLYLYFASLSGRSASIANAYIRAAGENGTDLPLGMFGTPVQLAQALDWVKENAEKDK